MVKPKTHETSSVETKKNNLVEKEIEKSLNDVDSNHEQENIDSSKFEDEIGSLLKKMDERKIMDKNIKLQLKKLVTAHKQDLKKEKSRKSRKGKQTNPTGFVKQTPITRPEFAKLLGVEVGTEMSGPQITQKIHIILEEKGLRYKKDKRIFRTNKEIRKVFLVDELVDESTDANDEHGFNFGTLQFFIKQAHVGEKLEKKPRKKKEKKEKKGKGKKVSKELSEPKDNKELLELKERKDLKLNVNMKNEEIKNSSKKNKEIKVIRK